MKRKANKLIIGIIFLAGLSLLLYPFVANQWNNYRQKQLISSYKQTVSEKDAAHEIDYDAELQKAEAYNEAFRIKRFFVLLFMASSFYSSILTS